MDYNGFFTSALGKLRDERRYRVFAYFSASPAASRMLLAFAEGKREV